MEKRTAKPADEPASAPGTSGGSEVAWRPWSREAFNDAQRDRKPVLLSISASWCHWCHVMDDATFASPAVSSLINQEFIPVRVDTDVRPDINSKYNMGGWPTVAILDNLGRAMDGATYVAERQMEIWLQSGLPAWRGEMSSRITADELQAERPYEFTPSWDAYHDIVGTVIASYDPEYGGFGTAPKFPMFDAIHLVLAEHVRNGRPVLQEIATRTLSAMTLGGTYDHVEGGLFRYSTVRDWSVPHYEKMLLDNSLLLSTLAQATASAGFEKKAFEASAWSTARFLNTVLFVPAANCWAGSQDADEDYYSLPAENRSKRTPPRVDRRIYADWNGRAVSGMIRAGQAFSMDEWIAQAVTALKAILGRHRGADQGRRLAIAHVCDEQGPRVYGLANDAISVGAACLDAFDATHAQEWLNISAGLATELNSTHGAGRLTPGAAGILSRIPGPDDPASFGKPNRDFHENAYAAIWFSRLSQLSSDPRTAESFRAAAHSCLAFCNVHYRAYGVLGAAYALALGQCLEHLAVPAREDANAIRSPLRTVPAEVECEGGVCRVKA
ncbi:MAG: DUF255 domain-containing protein [Clostridia bacterium]|nr:DUF255 domain-containing protein [Clostridia bacterium]